MQFLRALAKRNVVEKNAGRTTQIHTADWRTETLEKAV